MCFMRKLRCLRAIAMEVTAINSTLQIFGPDLRGVATETKGFNAARWPLEICDLRIDHWDLS